MNLLRKKFSYSYNRVWLSLIAINTVIFCVSFFVPWLKSMMSISVWGLLNRFYWQPVSYMFAHSTWTHLLFNMLALWGFGCRVESALGSKEFVLFYFVCGILTGIISTAFYFFLGIPTFLLGASGAVYAVLLAYAVLFPGSRLYLYGIIPVPAPILVIGCALVEFFSQFFQGGRIAHAAHLFGFMFAWLYIRIRFGVRPLQVWRDTFRR